MLQQYYFTVQYITLSCSLGEFCIELYTGAAFSQVVYRDLYTDKSKPPGCRA